MNMKKNMRRSGSTRTIETDLTNTEDIFDILKVTKTYEAQLYDYNKITNTIKLSVPFRTALLNSRNAAVQIATKDNDQFNGIVDKVDKVDDLGKYIDLVIIVKYNSENDIEKTKERIRSAVEKQISRQRQNGFRDNARLIVYAGQIKATPLSIKVEPRNENPPIEEELKLSTSDPSLNEVVDRIVDILGTGYDVNVVKGTPSAQIDTIIFNNYEVKTMTDTNDLPIIALTNNPGAIQRAITLSTNVFRTAKRIVENVAEKFGDVDLGSTAKIEKECLMIAADGTVEYLEFNELINKLVDGARSPVQDSATALTATLNNTKKTFIRGYLKNKKTGKSEIFTVDNIDYNSEIQMLSLFGKEKRVGALDDRSFIGEVRISMFELEPLWI